MSAFGRLWSKFGAETAPKRALEVSLRTTATQPEHSYETPAGPALSRSNAACANCFLKVAMALDVNDQLSIPDRSENSLAQPRLP